MPWKNLFKPFTLNLEISFYKRNIKERKSIVAVKLLSNSLNLKVLKLKILSNYTVSTIIVNVGIYALCTD